MSLIDGSDSGGATGFDPAGFQLSVVMNIADGTRIPLWMKSVDSGEAGLGANVMGASGSARSMGGMGSGSGSSGAALSGADLAGLDLPIVESVSIELSLGLTGKVTVDVATTYELGLKLLDSPFFAVGNTIEVQLGYPRSRRFTPWMTAILNKPSLRISPDEGLTATLNGDGGGFAALRGVSDKTWEARSYRDICEEIADEHDWDHELPGPDSVDVILAGAGFEEVSEFLKKRDVTSQHGMTDWFFVQHICLDAGCHAFLGLSDNKGRFKLFVKERASFLADKPKLKFLARGNSDFKSVFPALEFETEAEFVWLRGGSCKTSTQDISAKTKKIESHEATQATSSEPMLGDSGTPNSEKHKPESATLQLINADGPGRTGEYLVVSSRSPRGARAVAQSHRDILTLKGGITASLSSFGIPELFPADIVELDGMGVFNGLYAINSLTHTANDSEWTMRLELLNNASASGLFYKYFVSDVKELKKNVEGVPEDGGEAGGGEVEVEPVDGAS